MIRVLLIGAARAVFQVGIVLLVTAGLLCYIASRLLRAGLTRGPAAPVPQAAWELLQAGTMLANALGRRPRGDNTSTLDTLQ